MRLLFILAALLLPAVAHAQSQRIPTCGSASPPPGISAPYMDANGNTCVSSSGTTADVYSGNGSLATSTSSAAINTMTVNSSGAALPSTLSRLVAFNVGATDAAICVAGGTCTCPANGVAATNGLTLKAGGGYNLALSGVASSTPTVVACTGTPTVQFQW